MALTVVGLLFHPLTGQKETLVAIRKLRLVEGLLLENPLAMRSSLRVHVNIDRLVLGIEEHLNELVV